MPLFLPGFERRDLGPDGGPYDDRARPKIGWHMTQGSTLEGAETAFKRYPPHLGVDPKRRIKRQYVDLHRHAYAFAGAENDDEYIVQIEVVGFAEQAHLMPEDELRWLGEEVVRPLRDAIGVPDTVVRHGFRGAGEGIVLASPRSPIRLTSAELREFSGHLGHQHMPDPDHHWDPGALPIRKILAYSQEDDMPTAPEVALAVLGYRNARVSPPGRDVHWYLVETYKAAAKAAQTSAANQATLAAIAKNPDITPAALAAVVDEAVERHTPTAEQTAAALVPLVEDIAERVLGADNADLADEFLRQLREALPADTEEVQPA